SSGKSFNLTSKYYNELAAVVYADIFGYPLTIKEAKLWAIRKKRVDYSREKYDQAREVGNLLIKIPTVEAIFLTGSAAALNAKKDADVDLLIITSANTLWLTRAVIFIILKIIGKFKNPVCPNMFLDLCHLEIKNKNLFTAHEILQAKCVYERNKTSKQWLDANKWAKEYLPIPFELVAFLIQYYYQKSKQSNEKISWGQAFFHPNDLSEKVLKKFDQRLLKYGGK
ncbi:hypothetical protein HY310_02385, partial [Candidatus Microgenomates bacterium]|nr:hypothetical protein [Candidatus Microgenomates bacterium]